MSRGLGRGYLWETVFCLPWALGVRAGEWCHRDLLEEGHAAIRKEDGLEGRDQAEDPFYESRKNTTQSSGNSQEGTDVGGRLGTDSLGTGASG